MAEVRLQSPVQAKYLVDWPENPDPGAFTYYTDATDNVKGLIYCCPCGCKQQGSLRFYPKSDKAAWHWDGNRETPTLSPSVHHIGHWHGFLQQGKWVQA